MTRARTRRTLLAAPTPGLLTAAVIPALLAGCGSASAPPPPAGTTPSISATTPAPSSTRPQEITLAFAGDVHFTERTLKLLDDPKTAFGPIAGMLSAADLSMINLETAVTDRGTAEPKQYHFRAPASAFDAVKAAGVDVVTVANNHVLDYGQQGLQDTLDAARGVGMPTVGAGRNAAEANAPWTTDVKGNKIAVFGMSQIWELAASWVAKDDRGGVAHASDADRMVRAIKEARTQVDIVIVYMHWGQEGNACPISEQRDIAQKFAAAGADLIVGTHAHLLLGDGWLGRTFVQYGLGNFIWWWNDAFSNDTGVLRVTIRDKRLARTELVPASISRETGQPLPVTGTDAERIERKYAQSRGCTGLASQSARSHF